MFVHTPLRITDSNVGSVFYRHDGQLVKLEKSGLHGVYRGLQYGYHIGKDAWAVGKDKPHGADLMDEV